MNIFKNNLYRSLAALLITALVFVQISCDDSLTTGDGYDESLTLTGVRYASPDSSAPEQVGPGDVVVIQGKNMNSVGHVFFNDYEAVFNPALTTDSTLIVTIPADMPFGTMDPDADYMNKIKVTNSGSEAVLDFPVLPPAPKIARMSNEYANPGEEVTIMGQYLYLVTSVTFPGDIRATEFQSNPDGSVLTLTVPDEATTSGSIQITTSSGTDPSTPNFEFHDQRGMVCNFDDVFNYAWWAAIHPADPSAFPGAEGQFAVMEGVELGAGVTSWWNSPLSINLNSVQWVGPSYLGEPLGNFALKFELSVNGVWNAAALLIRTQQDIPGGGWTYSARYEPWRMEDGSIEPYEVEGWRTVVLPLSEFRTQSDGLHGTGASANTISAILPDGRTSDAGIMLFNDTEYALENAQFAIDNIRVVRIAE